MLEETEETKEEEANVPDQHPQPLPPPPGLPAPASVAPPLVQQPPIVHATPANVSHTLAELGGGITSASVPVTEKTKGKTNNGRKPRTRKEVNRNNWPSRSERQRERQRRSEAHAAFVEDKSERVLRDSCELFDACFADWSTVSETAYHYSAQENAFYSICARSDSVERHQAEVGYRAVTKGIPRTYVDALKDPVWGEPARKEWNTIMETKAIVEVNPEIAQEAIRNGADLVVLFPVYEEKEKEGQLVKKVRLVGDGRTHYGATDTYSPTPSREELLILLHIIATRGWEFVHVDEVRAFLNADYKGKKKVFAKVKGAEKYYEILKALYGLKTSSRDYNLEVVERLKKFGFRPLVMSPQLFVLREVDTGLVLIIYDWVDDFIFTGSHLQALEDKVSEFTDAVNTTKPVWNPTKVLGMELERDRERGIICVRMTEKITELATEQECTNDRPRHVPIPQSGYLVREQDYEGVKPATAEQLSIGDVKRYMKIVGCLIWLTGVRLDIIFAVTYLAWFTKEPRRHHLNMALHVVGYLYQSRDKPLVLGGKGKISITAASDASYGTGPKGRSISGLFVRLGDQAGGILGRSHAAHTVSLSSFEAELDAYARGTKVMRFLYNFLEQLGIEQDQPVIQCDNQAMIAFVKGEGVAKGVRHMEIRKWYVREQYQMGNIDVQFVPGSLLSADKFTKLGDRLDHQEFMYNVLGLGLLPVEGAKMFVEQSG